MTETPPLPPGPERVFLVVVDESPELLVALHYASRRALHTGGRVVLLHVIPPTDPQQWMTIESLMREEKRQEAEALTERYAAEVAAITGALPEVHIKEGLVRDELLKLIDEDPSIMVLVLAASAGETGPGPLVAALTSKFVGRLRVPITIVPGKLSDAEIAALA